VRALLLVVPLATASCTRQSPARAASPPAKVEKLPGESDLVRLTLTPAAEQRLGITTAAVERKSMPRWRAYGGEVIVPFGAAFTVSAPLAGHLDAAAAVAATAGSEVAAGAVLFRLTPVLAPEARTNLATALGTAEGEVAGQAVQRAAAKAALDRAERLLGDRIGTARAVEEARAAHDLAIAALAAAERNRDVLAAASRDLGSGGEPALPITSPIGGELRAVHAAAGLIVPAGAPLFEVSDLRRLWVRVGVHGDDARLIDAARDARVGSLRGRAGDEARAASPVPAPLAADPATAAIWLHYALDNADRRYRPGQRVGVELPLASTDERLVLAWSAVLHDISGGTWVYVRAAEHAYVRRRVEVAFVAGDTAVLQRGLEAGSEVVTAGAAELFGTEFGGGK
jgi:RND family efflux transporter MFP subunit